MNDPNDAANQFNWPILFGFVMSFNTLIFLIAKCKDDMSIIDITWGLMHVCPNLAILLHRVLMID